MAIFPVLSTGAVTQYPLGVTTSQSAQVIRFIDGTDQRFRTQGRMLRQWQIHLSLLNEDELTAIEAFFVEQLGGFSIFTFPDPYSGTAVANCRFGQDALQLELEGVDASSTSFWVIETNG